jgi:hypothetical protein
MNELFSAFSARRGYFGPRIVVALLYFRVRKQKRRRCGTGF